MKITKVEAIPLRMPEEDIKYKSTGVNEALIVKVYTDEGIVGIGESWTNAVMGESNHRCTICMERKLRSGQNHRRRRSTGYHCPI